MERFEVHSHNEYSNIRGKDSCTKITALIDYAIEQGLRGLAITDHETLSGHAKAVQYLHELKKDNLNLDFKLILGNEMYLVDERKLGQKYYHCILLANGERGYRALKELSSHSWMKSYSDRKIERVPTLKSELQEIVERYPKCFIATSACLGGELGTCILEAKRAKEQGQLEEVKKWSKQMHEYLMFMKKLFREDFYLEVAPSQSEEQLYFNNIIKSISNHYHIKIVLGTDAHYLRKEDYFIQEALLTSQEQEREVRSFYEYAYLQTEEEIKHNLKRTPLDFEKLCETSMEIFDKLDDNYNLFRSQKIPKEDVIDYPKENFNKWEERVGERNFIKKAFLSDNKQERYYINQVVENLERKGKLDEKRLDRIDEECDILYTIGNKLNDCMFAYSNTLQQYIDLIWDCGSIVGPGRGCFLPDMLVTLKNGETKPIVDIEEGDIVINDDGRSNKVLDKFVYDAQEEMTEILICGKNIKCTNDHKILVMHRELCKNDSYKNIYCKGKSYKRNKKCKVLVQPAVQWIEAGNITSQDMLVYPKPVFKHKTIYKINLDRYGKNKVNRNIVKVDKNFAEFIGLYLGNGWLINNDNIRSYKVGNSFSKNAEDKILRYEYLVEKVFGEKVHRLYHKTKDVCQLYIYNKAIVKMLDDICSHYASDKKIPDILITDDKECIKGLIIGMMATKGCYKEIDKITYSSSYSLCSQMKMCFAYLGYYGNIIQRTHRNHETWNNEYKVCLSGTQLKELKKDFLPLIQIKTNKRFARQSFIQDDNNFYFCIKGIKHFYYKGKVYDLHVENNHTYMINNTVVHNSAASWTGNYGLGITQIDPMEYSLYHWRFLNKERPELPDIDIDLCPSAIDKILQEIRKRKFDKIIGTEIDKQNLGIVRVATFGTETTKSAIHTAFRGFRSKEYPNGISSDEADYLSNLVPQERGFVWSIDEVVNGNPEKGRKPCKAFIDEISKYGDKLLKIIQSIEGLITRRGTHASGVILVDGDPFEMGCYMRSPSGEICTQWDLHMSEAAGMTKFDFLITSTSDKMVEFIKMMQKKKFWEKGTIRELYNKYLHPDVIDYSNSKLWDTLAKGIVTDCFQFSTPLSLTSAKKCHPNSVEETASLTSIMRLVIQEGVENPVDRFQRMKEDISLWYKEVRDFGLTEEEIKKIEPYFLPAYGSVCQQEDLMMLFMGVANFTLMEANQGRKIISKKQMNKIPSLREKFMNGMKGEREVFKNYVWDYGVVPLLGYGFPKAHAVPYSIIGIQNVACYLFCALLWNTACLIINSASIEEDEEDGIAEEENDKNKKSAQYDKIGSAIKKMQMDGIKIVPVDINKSGLTFEPDIEEGEILYGFKPLASVNENDIEVIMSNRPYFSFEDFLDKVQVNKELLKQLQNEAKRKNITEEREKEILLQIEKLKSNKLSDKTILTLIKAGAFDKIEDKSREDLVVNFCRKISPQKKSLDMKAVPFLIQNNLIETSSGSVQVYQYKNTIKKDKVKIDEESYYGLSQKTYPFYEKYFDVDLLEEINGKLFISEKEFEKQYKNLIRPLQEEIKDPLLLEKVNKTILKQTLIKELKNKYDRSAWEMETMCFYFSGHELNQVDLNEYGLENFSDLEDKEVESYFTPRGKRMAVPLYRISTIIGTVVSKNKTRATISLNTPDGIVEVKFNKEFFSLFDKRITKPIDSKKKQVIEESWFKRGTILMVSGYRDEDIFRCKVYKKSKKHRLYRVYKISNDKEKIYYTHERRQQ